MSESLRGLNGQHRPFPNGRIERRQCTDPSNDSVDSSKVFSMDGKRDRCKLIWHLHSGHSTSDSNYGHEHTRVSLHITVNNFLDLTKSRLWRNTESKATANGDANPQQLYSRSWLVQRCRFNRSFRLCCHSCWSHGKKTKIKGNCRCAHSITE